MAGAYFDRIDQARRQEKNENIKYFDQIDQARRQEKWENIEKYQSNDN